MKIGLQLPSFSVPGGPDSIRASLAEFGRLTGAEAPPTLLALLGLVPSASEQQVQAGWTAWRARARELPAGRLRAVVEGIGQTA